MLKIIIVFISIGLGLAGCATSSTQSGSYGPSRNAGSSSQSAEEAEAAAEAALAAMDGGGKGGGTAKSGGGKAQSGGGGSTGPAAKAGGKEPAWVSAPETVYPASAFVAATGFGADRNQAERDSLAKLVAVFGQSIQAELSTIHHYSEAVSRGKVQVSEDTSVQNAIKTSSEMDALIGAEIKDVWFDSKSTYYAVAALEKNKAKTLYADLIAANQRVIESLLAMTDAEKYSLDGYARCQFAATVADANYVYANVLTMVDSAAGSALAKTLKKGDSYRVDALNITKAIPIGIEIDNDRSNRIKDVFAAAIAKQGFRSGGINARYAVRVKVSLLPVDLPNQPNKFVRYVVDANFVDTLEESVIVPFNINGREGHVSLSEAENRAVAAAEKKIAGAYSALLSNYLANILPKPASQ
ncbi:MAG: LPP20 family lipoprotein [Spirochaetaceae bacterium]|jgi:hypothetical protein|nr:LPP20 family lipoprotein [Spirochaetaceae bacterium]